jgi:hypothetical protein
MWPVQIWWSMSRRDNRRLGSLQRGMSDSAALPRFSIRFLSWTKVEYGLMAASAPRHGTTGADDVDTCRETGEARQVL